MEAVSLAIKTHGVRPVARKKDADMHFVGLRLEPAEIAFYAVPGPRPFVLFILAVVRITIDHELLPLFGETREGDIGGDLQFAARPHQVLLGFQAMAGEPWFYNTLRQRSRMVRNCQVIVNADHPAEAFTLGTSTDRMVEAKQGRGGVAIFDVALGAVETVAE